MAAKRKRKWMQKAFPKRTRGALHRELGVPADQTIPVSRLRSAAKKKGRLGRRARAALTAGGISRRRKKRRLS